MYQIGEIKPDEQQLNNIMNENIYDNEDDKGDKITCNENKTRHDKIYRS